GGGGQAAAGATVAVVPQRLLLVGLHVAALAGDRNGAVDILVQTHPIEPLVPAGDDREDLLQIVLLFLLLGGDLSLHGLRLFLGVFVPAQRFLDSRIVDGGVGLSGTVGQDAGADEQQRGGRGRPRLLGPDLAIPGDLRWEQIRAE